MSPPVSAGILMYRWRVELEVLLSHPGGPFWRRKDDGAWMLPKGKVLPGEELDVAARREFFEEIGMALDGTLISLGSVKQKGGKVVEAFAIEGDIDVDAIHSNEFTIEWSPRSGSMASFPEVDRAAWFATDAARRKILPSQEPFLDRLLMTVARA